MSGWPHGGLVPSYEIRWEGARNEVGTQSFAAPQIISASDWMDALAMALDRFGLERRTLERAVCLLTHQGTIDVADPDTGSRFVVRQVEGDDDPAEQPSLKSSEMLPDIQGQDAPAPRRTAANKTVDRAAADALAKLSTDLGQVQAAASVKKTGLAVLDLLLQRVPAESGSVLLVNKTTRKVHFSAVRGPAADALDGVSVPHASGIIGVVIRTGTSLLVHEAEGNPEHYRAVDQASGYRTRSLLACPITIRGQTVGAVELLNPFGGVSFTETHRKATELAARRLSALLGSH